MNSSRSSSGRKFWRSDTLEVEIAVEVEKAVPTLNETIVLDIAVLTVLTIVEVEEHAKSIAESNWL